MMDTRCILTILLPFFYFILVFNHALPPCSISCATSGRRERFTELIVCSVVGLPVHVTSG